MEGVMPLGKGANIGGSLGPDTISALTPEAPSIRYCSGFASMDSEDGFDAKRLFVPLATRGRRTI